MEKLFCERCEERLDPSTAVWLELDQDTGRYTDQPLPEGHTSQGGFSFGRACAKSVLSNGGVNDRMKKSKSGKQKKEPPSMPKKNKLFEDCTIMRTVEVTHENWNMVTGETKFVKKETVTQPCGTPLFSDLDRKTGVCRSCRDGWEAEGNVFANDAERTRAQATQVKS